MPVGPHQDIISSVVGCDGIPIRREYRIDGVQRRIECDRDDLIGVRRWDQRNQAPVMFPLVEVLRVLRHERA